MQYEGLEIYEMDVHEYCDSVFKTCSDILICADQIYEILGGVANLYTAVARRLRDSEITLYTMEGFASIYVSIFEIMNEIENCSGISQSKSEQIYYAMRDSFNKYFKTHNLEKGMPIRLNPLGIFKAYDLDASSYLFTYIDNSAKKSDNYLISDSNMDIYGKNLLATLIHVSDTHFGDVFKNKESIFYRLPLRFKPHSYQIAVALSNEVNNILRNRKTFNVPSTVILSGDLTCKGTEQQLQIGSTFLRSGFSMGTTNTAGFKLGFGEHHEVDIDSSPALFYVPGNHDLFWGGKNPRCLAAYHEHFPGPYPKQLKILAQDHTIYLHGLDSTQTSFLEHKVARGDIRIEQLSALRQRIGTICLKESKTTMNILVLHHPLIAHNMDITMDLKNNGDFTRVFKMCGIDLVLSGHFHYRDVLTFKADDNIPNQAISGSSAQMHQKCNFSVIDIYKDRILLQVLKYRGDFMTFILDETNTETFPVKVTSFF